MTTQAQSNQAQLDVLGVARAISTGHRLEAAAVLDGLGPDENI